MQTDKNWSPNENSCDAPHEPLERRGSLLPVDAANVKVSIEMDDLLRLIGTNTEAARALFPPDTTHRRPRLAPIGTTRRGMGQPRKWVKIPVSMWVKIVPLINLYKPELAAELDQFIEGNYTKERQRGRRRRHGNMQKG